MWVFFTNHPIYTWLSAEARLPWQRHLLTESVATTETLQFSISTSQSLSGLLKEVCTADADTSRILFGYISVEYFTEAALKQLVNNYLGSMPWDTSTCFLFVLQLDASLAHTSHGIANVTYLWSSTTWSSNMQWCALHVL